MRNLEEWTRKGSDAQRGERIRRSLEALNAPNLINLTLEQWKEILEEAEDDDD
jgi:hypothetical protein